MKILIIRFSSIGDIVLTTPVIRCLKKQLDCELHFLTKKNFQSILVPNPYLDKIHTLDQSLSRLITQLKAEKYDYIIDLHNNLRSQHVKWALRCTSYTFKKLNFEKWLLVNFKINRLPDVHIVDRYLATTAGLGVKNDGQGLDYFIPKEMEVDVSELLGSNTPYIAFAIGAAHATKRLPKEKTIAICQQIQMPVVLLGGPAEAEVGEAIAKASGMHVHNTCGKLKLHQSASVVRQARKVITHDTGMMHIAAAFQKEIISIWGNTIPAFGMTPYYGSNPNRNQTIEVPNLACRPCSKIGHATCPKGHFDCMQRIDIAEVVQNVT